MCLSCACGEPNLRRRSGDIVLDDVSQAARNHGMDVRSVADNIHAAVRALAEAGRVPVAAGKRPDTA